MRITEVTITCGRKHSQNYSTREVTYSVTLALNEGDAAHAAIDAETANLQAMVDAALGDTGSPASFAAHTPRPATGTLHPVTEGDDDPFAKE